MGSAVTNVHQEVHFRNKNQAKNLYKHKRED